jgi:hypothetical protein
LVKDSMVARVSLVMPSLASACLGQGLDARLDGRLGVVQERLGGVDLLVADARLVETVRAIASLLASSVPLGSLRNDCTSFCCSGVTPRRVSVSPTKIWANSLRTAGLVARSLAKAM